LIRKVRFLSVPLLCSALLWLGCAVQHSKAPQIDAKTTYALNLESQVSTANKDYTTLFTDIGNAHRAGQLTDGDVASLNAIGNHLRGLLTEADRLTKVYATNYDANVAAQIGALLAQISVDITQITSQKAGAKR